MGWSVWSETLWSASNEIKWSVSADFPLYVIGSKWKLRIIVALTDGNKRFNELQRLIEGISAKVLSTELKDMELNGFVRRNVYASTPVVIEYELTEYADTLSEVLDSLSAWGAMHRETVKNSMKKKKPVVA
ncbi:transcriptional regulator [archaeon]|nr:MAG: transcriptional regulator [archaeon]